MRIRRFEQEFTLAQPLEEVFAFFSDAGNLDRVTPPWLGFRILTPPPIRIEAGAVIRYRLRIHGVAVGWETEITAWEPPCRFVDVQRRGPYRRWIHEHRFEEVPGGTRMQDTVEFALPGWILEPLLYHILVRRDVERIFAYRREAFSRLFGAAAGMERD
jgi:ligand-binding SRPBCC domain-containing protein